MTGTLSAIAVYFLWGLGDFFTAQAAKRSGAFYSCAALIGCGLLLNLVFLPAHIGSRGVLSIEVVTLGLAAGLVFVAGNALFTAALEAGNPVIVLPISSSFSAIIIFLSWAFLGEPITSFQICMVGVILLGIACACGIVDRPLVSADEAQAANFRKGIILAIVTAVTWGVSMTFAKAIAHLTGWYWACFLILLPGPLHLFYLYKSGRGPKATPKLLRDWFYLLTAGVLIQGGNLVFYHAIAKHTSISISPIAGAYPTLSVVLGYFVFKDRLTRLQGLGVFFCLVGILGLAQTD